MVRSKLFFGWTRSQIVTAEEKAEAFHPFFFGTRQLFNMEHYDDGGRDD